MNKEKVSITQRIKRLAFLFLIIISFITACYYLWIPGDSHLDHQFKANHGIWLQHGWLGHDTWFDKYKKDKS
ncbi:MAG: hypothetical protein HRT88_04040, partial [Lentisphaeraceae bacterium]|nr:hypothetical protein [Lentisphaeraceae bacterium]